MGAIYVFGLTRADMSAKRGRKLDRRRKLKSVAGPRASRDLNRLELVTEVVEWDVGWTVGTVGHG